jgi:hypothetical protein
LGRDSGVNVLLFCCGILVCRHRETYPFAVFRSRQVLEHLPIPSCSTPTLIQIFHWWKLLYVTRLLQKSVGGWADSNQLWWAASVSASGVSVNKKDLGKKIFKRFRAHHAAFRLDFPGNPVPIVV